MEITESFIEKNNAVYIRPEDPEVEDLILPNESDRVIPPEIVDSSQAPEPSDVKLPTKTVVIAPS